MKIRVRVSAEGMRRKARVLKSNLSRVAEKQLRDLAAAAIALVQGSRRRDRAEYVRRQVDRQLKAVFVPVELQHKRKERWPDLRTIYNTRIIRGQATFRGIRRFYVDEHKEDALREELLRLALPSAGRTVTRCAFESKSSGAVREGFHL